MSIFKLSSGSKLATAYALMVLSVYTVCLFFPIKVLYFALCLVTMPLSLLVGLAIVTLAHAGYYIPVVYAFLCVAVVNCLCLYLIGNRFSSGRKSLPEGKATQ